MPVYLNRDLFGHSNSEAGSIHIGLVNNMPDGALEATERQFLTLLNSVAGSTKVSLSLYAIPEVPRTESGQNHISRFYSRMENLQNGHLDGLIVTGTEPRASRLQDEPYWGRLATIIDWAEQNTFSTIWSCLAAHAAILHIDGIHRRRLKEKLFGVFECERASNHALTAGAFSNLRTPHSRWNDLPEEELTNCGYSILTRSADAGVDTFAKKRRSLFVFFQGHPEYEANTLLLEYRREVARYLRKERDTYPSMPRDYFDWKTADEFAALEERLLADPGNASIADFPLASVEARLANNWLSLGVGLYSNWLNYLSAQKQHRVAAEKASPCARSPLKRASNRGMGVH